jgi:HK97 family phage portal protein
VILKKLLNRPKSEQPTSQRGGILFPKRVAGVLVNDDTALTYSAVYLAIKIISESLASLPTNVYTRKPGSDDRQIARNHPLANLLKYPNPEMTGFNFFRTLISHAALRGNGYAYIERDKANRPSELWLITPDRVTKTRDKNTGRVVYVVTNGTDDPSYYTDDQILHLPGMGFDGMTGYSIVELAARSFGLGMAAEQFGASFYENGAQLGTVIEVPPEIELDEAGKDLLLTSFDEKHKGVKHHHRTAIVDAGMKVTSMGIPQKDAQFIESRKFSVTDVARWFNMPPHKLKDLERATFSNIEEQNIDFVQDTLMPWIINIEQTINWKLIGKNNRVQFVKFNVNALMRGNAEARANYYNTRFQMGSLNINEIKALEDENGIGPKGDKYFMQSNMATIDNIIDPPEPPAPRIPTTTDDDADSGEEAYNVEGGAVENLERFRPLINDAIGRIINNVDERVGSAVKKGDAKNKAEALPIVLESRRAYIENTIKHIVLAMVDCDRAHVRLGVDLIVDQLQNGDRDGLAGDFMAFCATIATTEAATE